MITVYPAKKIISMNSACKQASHIAVRDGRILGAGSLADLEGWGDYELDQRFADKIIMPGFVEGHSHTTEGSYWKLTYVGYFDRLDPQGKLWPGARTIDEAISRLREIETGMSSTSAPLSAWALDPIYFNNERVSRQHLDQVSTDRPVGILHASGHAVNVNSRALEMAGLCKTGIDHPGVPLAQDGLPTGELKGPEIMALVSAHIGFDRDFVVCDEEGMANFGKLCVRAGVTTATELAATLPEDRVELMSRVTAHDAYPVRVVAPLYNSGYSPADLIARAMEVKSMGGDRLRLGAIKIVVDGSIQGFTARLRAPGYYNGAANGLWYISPEQLRDILDSSLQLGIQVHIHTNGDEATEMLLDCMDECLRRHPSPDHRFTVQHSQLADAAQLRRMANLGMCVNLFANHHFYWGDEHYRLTVGPERALRMNACATALANRVPMAIHSDAPVTPLGPLFTAWCAINRITASGRVQGTEERISVGQALYAITLGAAYTLHLDGEIGSIQAGKRADLAILEDDPETIGRERIKDVTVWGTMQGGRVFAAAEL